MAEHHPAGRELSSYLDGALPVRRGESVRRHVEACETCSQDLAALRGVRAALAGQQPEEPNPGWLARVEVQVASGARPASTSPIRLRRRIRLVAGGTVVATVAFGAAVWLAPPAPAPVPFQDEVRQHLVQMDNPLGDQTSYVVEARYP